MPVIKASASSPSRACRRRTRARAASCSSGCRARHRRVRLDEETAAYTQGAPGLPRDDVPEGCDLVIVLGGDGTLLSAARAIGRREIPLFPVNLGGLGFLTAITIDEIYPGTGARLPRRAPHRHAGSCWQPRWCAAATVVAQLRALNDAVLTKAAIARMIDLETLRGRSVRLRVQGRRADRLDAHRLHRLFAVGRRPDHLSLGAGHLHHADLPAHADQPAGARAGDQRDPASFAAGEDEQRVPDHRRPDRRAACGRTTGGLPQLALLRCT